MMIYLLNHRVGHPGRPSTGLVAGLALALPNATGHTLHVLLSDRQAVIIRMLGDLGFLYEL